ncbi:MAG: 23S rRNA (pseudouridine(1915)-N(3))-methyltransferase RlmH [Chitinophagaceae bacterium]|nr:23S rRNA (pseudouridine(1915)-N(3))-methyltransferase RlmH [Chitinophagaceae bacterium]
MKLACWCIGKKHEPYIQPGVEEFTRRIGGYFPIEWKLFPPAPVQALPDVGHLKQEAEAVLKQLDAQDYLVALDRKGKLISSKQLASLIEQRTREATRRMVFFIGGAYGTDELLLQKARFVWSLSPLVFPHQLVRLILAEQLYRACTILNHEAYHHES